MTVTHFPTRFTIGGSDAAAAAGIDPHKSRVMLWLEKTGRIQRPETEAMRWGKLLRPVVFAELEARGYHVFREGLEYTDESAERKWVVGHPDAFVYESGDLQPGGRGEAVLEVKTVGQWAMREWNGKPPLQYVAQVQHYLHLTGLDRGLLAVLVGGQRLDLHEIRREQHAIDALLRLEEQFYAEHLLTDTPPAPDSSDSAREALAAMFPEHVPVKVMRLDKACYGLLQDLRARREQRKTIERQEQGLENLLKLAMGDAEVAISPHDEEVIRWRAVESTRLDVQRLKAERPDVYEQFATTASTRRFQPL